MSNVEDWGKIKWEDGVRWNWVWGKRIQVWGEVGRTRLRRGVVGLMGTGCYVGERVVGQLCGRRGAVRRVRPQETHLFIHLVRDFPGRGQGCDGEKRAAAAE